MKKLLLVDDDNNLITLLSSYLLSEGFVVNSALDVTSAFMLIKSSKPDLIITDIMLKKLDGYDFVKLIKLDYLLVDIPIIFLTAKGLTYDRIKGYNLGCHAYLTKPFNPNELLAIIKNIFRQIELVQISSFQYFKSQNFRAPVFNTLTYREKTILDLLLKGYMNKEIAVSLSMSTRNVEKYVSRLLNKTNTRNRTELVKTVLD
uniref:TctD-like protein n=1 Tax=Platysiphonia delicata TaxID=2006979 RepID=A0A1Z1M0P5_9FLOR|nr:hypothetical protein [Platysiphonia delicata]ARW59677.1 hypothetical protein [Platysiphonia delicata]